MNIAIMQPYIFPYIGYFQLVHASDTFVFYDDVNYINKGWINRNNILLNGKAQLFTLPCKELSQNKLIKDIYLLDDPAPVQKILATMQMAYKKAPFFKEVYPVIEHTLTAAPAASLGNVTVSSVKNVWNYLGLTKNFKTSSESYTNQELKKADRLIDICHIEGITDYVNAQGGKAIYTKEYFKERGVNLSFLIAENYSYLQFKEPFTPYLSIIDILMFNSKEEIINKILPSYHLE